MSTSWEHHLPIRVGFQDRWKTKRKFKFSKSINQRRRQQKTYSPQLSIVAFTALIHEASLWAYIWLPSMQNSLIGATISTNVLTGNHQSTEISKKWQQPVITRLHSLDLCTIRSLANTGLGTNLSSQDCSWSTTPARAANTEHII